MKWELQSTEESLISAQYDGAPKDLTSAIQNEMSDADTLSEWALIQNPIEDFPSDIHEERLIEDFSGKQWKSSI